MQNSWRFPRPCEDKGVIVASDARQEWILPWWWKHYHAHNSYPVVFVDTGMTPEAKEWCRKRGEVFSLHIDFPQWKEKEEIDPQTALLWESTHGMGFWPSRRAWFVKPFALLQTPFRFTLWLDLDCKAQVDLFFDFEETELALCPVPHYSAQETLYNSGVIAYGHGSDPVKNWAEQSLTRACDFLTDQHLLSRILFEKQYSLTVLPFTYNWHMSMGENNQAKIIHYLGDVGKELIWLELNLCHL
ncbi:MAG TPA: hypothetical protein VGJ00_02335 [Rhabdochlamydiaceae bacterium]|jgi:hypothetical protein